MSLTPAFFHRFPPICEQSYQLFHITLSKKKLILLPSKFGEIQAPSEVFYTPLSTKCGLIA